MKDRNPSYTELEFETEEPILVLGCLIFYSYSRIEYDFFHFCCDSNFLISQQDNNNNHNKIIKTK